MTEDFWVRVAASALAGLTVWMPIIWWNRRKEYQRGREEAERAQREEMAAIRQDLRTALAQQAEILLRIKL